MSADKPKTIGPREILSPRELEEAVRLGIPNVAARLKLHNLAQVERLERIIGASLQILPGQLAILRWLNGRQPHETRADGTCERHCARCQLEADPAIVRERKFRQRVAA